ncbi:BTB/POZ and MATH domain-containing protein 1-like [Lolium rigidum]|uniref:BTB/POZ and MATH domain-containing protein 1-like n=1 Tax=Lolium rigidum TaxID=89674 RepID=UPI001F5C79DA|nr:BTB/POZ and MATH domain-containing protein 1-like [Lolium rigidum]
MKATASMCSPRTVRGTHTFKIARYSLHRGLGAGRYVRSAAFDVGGYLWRIEYYPDAEMEMKNGDYASVSLELVTAHAQARATFEVRLLDQAGKLPPSVVLARYKPLLFRSNPPTYMSEDFLQPLPYLHGDDSLVVECDITVIKEPELALIATTFDIKVPPSDLSDNLKELLETGEETDVTFEVRGEVFPAHKLVLAMRSRVFKADLFGPMGDRTRKTIPVEDMQPAVFGALLHFIYTDSLPSMEHLVGDDAEEMVKHLLVAADRYAMERMKVLCESILCRTLSVRNVTTTLALADQHQCSRLKDACLDFIASPDRTDAVVASEGYACLKRSCPAVVADIFERATKSRKI